MISFVNLFWLSAALIALPLLIIFYIRVLTVKNHALLEFAAPDLIKKIIPSEERRFTRIHAIAYTVALFLILIAMAGPEFGFSWTMKGEEGIDILIAVDTSKSMLAADIAPTRLAAVKTDIKDFLKTARGDRVGLIAFSGSAFMICPLTVDIDGLSLMIDTINENSIPRGGTSFQSLLDETIRASDYNKIKDKTLIIYSDGETTTGRLSNLPRKTKSSDMSIYCIGVGTEKGSTITYKDTTGETRLIRDTNNETVVSRLEEQTLKEIAATSGGTYTRFRTDRNNLQALYVNDLKNIKRTSTDSMEKKRNNRFQIPLGIAILMLFWTEATRGKR